jgi:hypothetical protein
MLRLLFILAGAAGLVALALYLKQCDEPRDRNYEQETVFGRHPAEITMLCSDEKEEWIRDAATDFARHRPDITVHLKVMSSIEGMSAILSRQVTPTLWSPTETAMLRYVFYRWRQEFGEALFSLTGEDAPQPLARSPVVWLSWRSRIEAITEAIKNGRLKRESLWADIGCAGVPREPEAEWSAQPARWDELAAFTPAGAPPKVNPMSSWGEIKFFHTDPTRSNTGFYSIYLMAYQFMGQPERVAESMLERDAFITWFRRCQRLRRNFHDSVQALTNRPFQFGPENYDIVVTYENLALAAMNTSTNQWTEQPYLYYPPVSSWADHPIIIFNSSVLPRAQRDAARDWIAFLLSPERQRSLISFGLRPGRSTESLRSQRADNPFIGVNASRFNIQIEPASQPPPDLSGPATDRLSEIWRQATGYY